MGDQMTNGSLEGTGDVNAQGQDQGQGQAQEPEYLKEIKETLSSFSEAIGGLNERIEELASTRGGQDDSDDSKDEGRSSGYSDDINLELIDRKQFMGIMLEKVNDLMQSQLKDIKEAVSNVQTYQSEKSAQEQVNAAAKKYEDFWDWRDEMKELVTANPYLTAEQAYILARQTNPKKAMEIDSKKKGQKTEEKPQGFGGLTPTSGRTASKTNLTKEDAAETAWRRVFGGAGEST